MKIKFLSILAALALIAACENLFVTNILPDKNGEDETGFTVTFDRNGGDTDASPRTIKVKPPATTIDKMPEKPIWAGRTFIRWTANADGSGEVFSTATPVTADITVYAQWLEVPEGSFVVTFDSNGGDTDADPVSIVVTPPATNVGTLPEPPTWENHTFAGWNTQDDGSGTAFTASTTVNADITVYAKWTQGVTPPQTPPVVVDFEDDAIGKTYDSTGGYANDQPVSPTVKVVADPANAGQKSLEISSTGYNQAAIIPITLPAGKTLNDAESFSFRIRLTNGTISYKEVQVYAASSPATFEHGGFGNPADSEWAQFAANKLGETETIPELPLNQWHDYSISISGLNSAISNLSGTIYLAIGIQHSDTEAITYLLDDLTFTFGAPKPPPVSNIVDFENDALGATTKYTVTTAPNNGTGTVTIVADPANAGQKSLNMNSTGYNIGAVIPINLSKAVNAFNSFTFRFNMKTGSLENKDMMVYVADDAGKFTTYGFGNADGQNNFANLLLGQIRLTDVKNQWDTYAIAIENPGSAISTLSGDVFLAIGINHNDDITYLLDDLTFSDAAAPPPPAFPTLVDFEGDAVGKTYGFTRGDNDPTVTVAADPAAPSQKSLRVVTSSSSAWNQAAVIPIHLTDPLSTYRSFRFRFNLQTAGTLLDNDQPRKINVYVADNTDAFKRYSFGNPANNQNQAQQFANLLVGAVEPDYSETGNWVDYAINFSNPGSAINNLSGNVYIAIGINHNTGITYYLDDLTFSKDELIKQPGAALTGTLAVNTITASTVNITAGSVSLPPGSAQTIIEYSVSLTSAGAPGVWQTGLIFHGLTSEKSYTAYARSAANAFYNAGPAISSAPFDTLGKGNGAAVSAPTLASNTHNRIVINAVNPPGNGQTVEYAISTGTTEPAAGWQTGTIFTRLSPGTGYYVFARAKENDDYKAGAATVSAQITTNAGPTPNPNVPAFIIDFENDAVGKTYNATNAAGGNPEIKVVSDPDGTSHSNQRSLQISTSGTNAWNRGAIIPINLPFELQNYQSFTFRFYLISGSNIENNISVYLKGDSNYASGGFGNGPDSTYTKFPELLVGDVAPVYSLTNQWVEYEIDIDPEALNAAIKTLSGNVYLAIGINHGNALTYLFDDLTFNAASDFAPDPTISPTTATFVLAEPDDITVNMNLYGNTLTDIKNGNNSINPVSGDPNYTVAGNTVTLKQGYFNSMTAGTAVTLTFEFNNGKPSKTITITVIGAVTGYGGTWYDFTKAFATTPAITTSTNLTAKVESGVLEVNRPGGYGDPGQLMIPFDLGSTNLNTFTKLVLTVRCSRGTDFTNKNVIVAVSSDGTTWTNLRTQGTSNAPNDWTTSFKTIEIGPFSGIPSLTGSITIRIQWDQSNPLTYEFQYIGLN